MNPLFIEDLTERLGFDYDTILVGDQNMVKSKLLELDECDHFPMICYEHSSDSNFEVELDESKFLNDSAHSGTWIVGINSDDEIVFILNFKVKNGYFLEIDAIEIRDDLRGTGIGENLVTIIGELGYDYYSHAVVSPFDTSALSFWEWMDYKPWKDGYLIIGLGY